MLKRFSGIIYMYKSSSGKYYIGQTTRPKFRNNEHVSRAFNGSELPFHRAIRKYGMDSFEYSILCRITCSNTETLSEILDNLEQYYIVKYNSKVPTGYNASDGGEGNLGIILSSETRAKMSKAKKGHKVSEETREKMSEWQVGKKLSEDTKNKIRDSHIGKICNKRPCCQYTLDGEFISEYSSIKEAAEMNNINKVSISLVLSGKHKTAGGYTWKYKEDNNNNDAL